jgi:hypothetical protein
MYFMASMGRWSRDSGASRPGSSDYDVVGMDVDVDVDDDDDDDDDDDVDGRQTANIYVCTVQSMYV